MENDYRECQARVEDMVDRGKALERVQEEVNRMTSLEQGERDALMLWAEAWRNSHPRFGRQRKVVFVPRVFGRISSLG